MMNSMNIMKWYIIAVLLVLIVSACGKTPINGDLDGRWQILKIEYASGEEETPERAYYSVALHTINLSSTAPAFEGPITGMFFSASSFLK